MLILFKVKGGVMRKISKDVMKKVNAAKLLFIILMRPAFFVAGCVVAIGAGVWM